jgi:two-component system sensor kinase FixL
MMEQDKALNVAIVGGGRGCKAIMTMILAEKLQKLRMKLMGVASTDTEAVGYLYAKEKGIYTTRNYHDLYSLKDLNMIIELTGREEIANDISATKPGQVRLMDHAAARLFWDVFQIEEKRSSEREQAEEVLKKSGQEKQDILESISEAVVYLDREHRIMWANRVARKPQGLALEDVEGRRCYEVWHPLSKPCPGCPIVQTYETGQPQEAEMTGPDGREWFVRGYPVLGDNGDIVGAVELTLEITHRKRAEQKLSESEERHRTVLEACPDPVVVYDMEGKSAYVNPAFTQVFGWPPEELLGKKLDYVPEENWPETEVMIAKVKAGESFSDVESRRHTKEGEVLDVSISAGIFLDANGIPVGSVHILRDITDRKRIEAALRESEQRHRIVMEASPDPIVVYDMDGRCTYTNPAFTTVFGWAPEERLGKKLDYVPEENWPETQMMIEKVKVGESFSDVESRRHTKDGEIIDVSVSAGIYLTRDGIPVGSVHILRNITNRKRIGAALRESEQRHRTVLEACPDPVVVYDMEGKGTYVNPAFTRLFGWTLEEFLGKKLDYVPDESWPETQMMIDMVKTGKSFSDVESRRYTKEGDILDVSLSTGIYLDSAGVPVGSVNIVRDITQRKLAEEGLEDTMAELQRSNTELQQFAYVASHDLQEPLRKVQAFGNRLRAKYAEALDERGLDYMDRMQNAAKRMQSLINNLLTLSRITTKAQPFAQVNLADVVRGVMADLELHVERAGGHVEAGDMPTIDADPTQMRQLLQNLINNALKFHEPEKKPVVKIHSQLMNETCKITVEDNGIGFDEKYLDRIFAVFQRLHGRGKYDGTGVGLTICQKIAERHGGSITAKSTPGHGATFIVTLPAKHKRRGEASNG